MVSWCRVGDFCKVIIRWGFVSGGEIYVICNSFILPLHYEEPAFDQFQLLGVSALSARGWPCSAAYRAGVWGCWQ